LNYHKSCLSKRQLFFTIIVKTLFALFLSLFSVVIYGQLSFCNGSKGDPIFHETFGNGTANGPQLPAGSTSYDYVSNSPNDGQYTLSYQTGLSGSWHNSPDHTPDDFNGKSLIVNASYTAGEFYKRTVTGLCANTTFEFSAWVMNVYRASSNVCSGTGIPIDIQFEIWDETGTTLLKSGSTNAINGTNVPVWEQYGLTFTTLPTQTGVVLKMLNNGEGGCGNDLAIDDIMFRSCGDFATIISGSQSDNQDDFCTTDVPASVPLQVNIVNPALHVFQWQSSTDSLAWTDIPGEITTNYNATNFGFVGNYYRVKIAEDAANLSNPYCSTVSYIYIINVFPLADPPTSTGNKTICSSETIPVLSVFPDSSKSVDWYDAPTGGNLLASDTNTYTPTAAGTYYAEANYIASFNIDCPSATRTAITLDIIPGPQADDATYEMCKNSTVTLDAGITGVTYYWSTAETTQTIEVSVAGSYVVVLTSPNGCTATKNISVTELFVPDNMDIIIDGATATINITGNITSDADSLEYSLDGIHYQSSNVFPNLPNGAYTVYVRGNPQCDSTTAQFFILNVPKFFTPNGDGIHDEFQIPGMDLGIGTKVFVFDRYGKQVALINAENPNWNGTFNKQLLPSTDYWYRVIFPDGKEFKGHFSLKR
jgi:gliding motility-associated-like protein